MTGRVLLGRRRSLLPWLILAVVAAGLVGAASVFYLSQRGLAISDAPLAGCEHLAGKPPVTSASPLPSLERGVPFEIVVYGRDYDEVLQTDADEIRERGCAIYILTHRPDEEIMVIYYRLPDGLIPAGEQIERIDTRVCGPVAGDLWEVYGPYGSNPIEYENSQPSAADGCWHFEEGSGQDSQVTLYLRDNTTWRMERIVYTVTLAEAAT